MRLRNIRLNNFRNFVDGDISLNDQTTVFYGGVGEGKTNIIEAIFLLSVGRSYRTTETHQVINWGMKEAYVRGEGQNSNGNFAVAVKVTKNGKKIEMNGDRSIRSIDLVGGLRTVIFHADDIAIITGGPQYRRRFLDLAISQSSKNYAHNLRDYYRILKQRNSALAKRTAMDLSGWDEQLSTLGAWLTQIRTKVALEINQSANRIMRSIIGENQKLEINYLPSGDEDEQKFRLKLLKAMGLDTSRGSTSIGPHRDDFKIMLSGIDARHYASSGEKKTIALAIKLAEVDFIRTVTGEKPLLLLDDIFSTLDVKRSKALLSVTGDGAQCVITSTDLNFIRDEFKSGVVMNEVSKGRIIKQ